MPTNPASRSALQYSAVINRYCVTCHNQELRTAELVLSTLDVESISENAAVWEKVVGKLRGREMPPAGMPRPDEATIDSFVAYLETELDLTTETGAGRLAVHPPESADQQAGLQLLSPVPSHDFSPRALLDRYCVTCHNQELKTAELKLDKMDVEKVSENPAVWEKVVRKLRGREMPPVGMPRPNEARYDSFIAYLETELDRAARTNPNPGRTATAHRLNRAEYTNAIRDLLALEIEGEALLPADDSGGFDNLGDLLSVSPMLMERYMSAARKISRLAVGDPNIRPDIKTYTLSTFLMQNERMNEDLPFGSRGGIAIRHHFPLDGEYLVTMRLLRNDQEGFILGLAEPHHVDLRLNGERIRFFTIGGEHVGLAEGAGEAIVPPDFRQAQYERTADEDLTVRFQAKAGKQLLQVAFLKENLAEEGAVPPFSQANYTESRQLETFERAWADPALSSVSITGPFDAKGPGNTPSRHKIFICIPAGRVDEEPCAKKILSTLTRRAYRRPVTEEDLELLLSLYRAARGETGSFEAGIQMALEGLVVSTEFLFRIERDPDNAVKDGVYRISDLELASRLSFFLWSSIPDDELLEVAQGGKLREPAVLEEQVRRMLRDPRSKSLVDNFVGQWLFLRNLPKVNKDRDVFVEFDESLRQAFQQETDLFLESMFREDRSVLDLLRADYTFLNERLARHYGIPNVHGNRFRRISLADENRRGLLGQGSILMITALANRTSPVMRGKWVLENLLAAPPPPPPPDIPALKEKGEGGAALSIRQQMVQHRTNPACAICHNRMDPIGFGLENFDAVGKWRDLDAGAPIDASGVLPDGSKFQGPAELQQALLSRPERIANAVTEKLLMYALGRTLEYYDAPAVRTIVREAASSEYRWSSLILGIIESTPFQMRRSRTL
jgi:mono/diheme cytochrome c family protein